MTPNDPQPPAADDPQPVPPAAASQTSTAADPPYHWYHKMWSFVFITFCAEVGLFLLIFPWTDAWNGNYFSDLLPQLGPWWGNMYLRGAVSGLGVVDLYISIVEIIRLRPFVRR
jgi:hypothetical protein